ncbi:hypothetical protein GCM10010965_30040 [Caldalkalibacillus thermarum]|nr:hypothetical protein GCM10010965_30040 [Caldalkalibacillus thermarum]
MRQRDGSNRFGMPGCFAYWESPFSAFFGLYAYLAWLPTYLTAVMGYSKQEAGWIMALAMISQVIMAPVSGKVSDWMGQRKLTLVIGTGVLALCTVWLFGLQDLGIHLNALLIGMGISWSMAPMLTLATEVVHARMTGFVISLMNTLGQIASAISGYYYGLLFDRSGDFRMIWLSCLAALMIRILLCLGNWEKGEGMQVAENGKHLPA